MCLILVLVLVLVLVFVVLVLVVGWEGLSGLFRLRAGDGLLVDVLSFSFFAVLFFLLFIRFLFYQLFYGKWFMRHRSKVNGF
jgi:hypothetical protein